LFFFKQKTAYEISACLVGSEMCIRDRRAQAGEVALFDDAAGADDADAQRMEVTHGGGHFTGCAPAQTRARAL